MTIGELVMKKLKMVDEVAYVRFASVYREFKDVNAFMEELAKFLNNKSEMGRKLQRAEKFKPNAGQQYV